MKLLKTNFFLLSSVTFLIVGVFLVGVNQAGATTVTFAQDTTLALDVGNITIEANSVANEVTSTNTDISITIASGQTVVLLSSDSLQLSNNGGFGFTCEPTQTRLSISPSSTVTVVVTPLSTTCSSTGGTVGGGGGGGGGSITTTPTPTPTTTPTPTPTPAPSTDSTSSPQASSGQATPASKGFVSLSAVSLKDGDVISAAGSSDPDVYIVNPHGYKRLFLNPVIFGFYGHLGGFSKVKNTTSTTRDVFVTSGLFRNCETDDPKVYGVEVTGEDVGIMHWVNTTGEQAVTDDPDFFKKVFCINTNEFNWYPKGSDYTSVNQIPNYARGALSASSSVPTSKQYKVVSTVGYLNIRSSATTASSVLGQLSAGDTVTSLDQDGVWHKIMFEGQDAWVHGDYLQSI